MATKTISIEIDVYERLRALKSVPSESFSQVLRRALPPARSISASELLQRFQERPDLAMSEAEVTELEAVRAWQQEWQDPWTR